MDERPGIVVTGAAGRMGRALIAAVAGSAEARLVGALVRPGHAALGEDAGTLAGLAPLGVAVSDEPLEAFASWPARSSTSPSPRRRWGSRRSRRRPAPST